MKFQIVRVATVGVISIMVVIGTTWPVLDVKVTYKNQNFLIIILHIKAYERLQNLVMREVVILFVFKTLKILYI